MYLDVDPERGGEYGGGGEGHEGGGQQQEAGRGDQEAAARGAGGQGVEEAGRHPPHGQQMQRQDHQHRRVPVAQRAIYLHIHNRVNRHITKEEFI